eukprot:13153671-Ditylum_brightwellii.AAC.2
MQCIPPTPTPPGVTPLPSGTLPVAVESGYITYTNEFKYLGSYLTHDLKDTFVVRNHVVQATKALNSMMSH